MFPSNLGVLITSSVILAFIGVLTAVVTVDKSKDLASILLSPEQATSIINTPFTVQVIVKSNTPVNAFSGLLEFDQNILNVTAIDYNTSIADLWVTKPWYENGAGTINFAGGTTKAGGFTGEDTLLTITFTPIIAGAGTVKIKEAQILAHDGMGSELKLEPAIDALFTDASLSTQAKVVNNNSPKTSTFNIVNVAPSFDLNSDGKVGLFDISIFMSNFLSKDTRFDFNLDGKINTGDLSMLLNAQSDN